MTGVKEREKVSVRDRQTEFLYTDHNNNTLFALPWIVVFVTLLSLSLSFSLCLRLRLPLHFPIPLSLTLPFLPFRLDLSQAFVS